MKNQIYPSEEYKLLRSLTPLLHYKKSARYPVGVGDDAAIRTVKAGEQLVFTADAMVENVHFSFTYMTFQEVGYKAMAINLSDLAAMGALPDAALAQIIFPESKGPHDISKSIHSVYKGFNEACRTWHFPIIGGNLSKGPCFIIDITLIGRTGEADRLLLRRGAQKGEALWATGFPGWSAAGLSALRKWGSRGRTPLRYRHFIEKHIRPVPLIEIGRRLSQNPWVHAMIDISDGIAKECHTLAFENRLGIMLEPPDPAIFNSLQGIGLKLHFDPLKWYLYGGEDYELLFSTSSRFDPTPFRKKGVFLTRIGEFVSQAKGVHFKLNHDTIIKVEKLGWDNLRKDLE